ncbi:MAG: hydantoinase B/oxoprolinase family protein [Bdellovibrionales bacterium]|nr:hydantoinase B/oxoprolinase family protein [Bdellovibrionales bacterium]
MNKCFRYCQYPCFFENLLKDFPAAAVVTPEGESLFIKYETLADIGTLPVVAQIAHQYLQLKDGEIVIANDPYSGGTILSSYTLIMGLSVNEKKYRANNPQGAPADLLVVYRIAMKPRVIMAQSVDDEGIRIPPTPLYQPLAPPHERLNQHILSGLCEHPLSHPELETVLGKAIEQLSRCGEQFKVMSEALGFNWSKTTLKDYFKTSHRLMQDKIHEMALGECQIDLPYDATTTIKLRLEVTDGKVLFDFNGTDPSSILNLTDTATYGACVGAFLSSLDEKVPLNSGVFQVFDISAPTGACVNAAYPKAVNLGMTDGASLIGNLVLRALSQVDRSHDVALPGISQCSFEMEFAYDRRFYETLSPGSPATKDHKGTKGLSMWRRYHLDRRIEMMEALYPITALNYSFRPQSGGGGKYSGGDGEIKSLQVTEPAVLRWQLTMPLHGAEGAYGGKNGNPAEITVQRVGKKPEKLSAHGELNLEPGDVVSVKSAGGGGFGADA